MRTDTRRKFDIIGMILGITIDVVGIAIVQDVISSNVAQVVGMAIAIFSAVHLAWSYKNELDSVLNSRPRILFYQAVKSASSDRNDAVWQIWFSNRPVTPTPEATAREVTAQITFFDASGTELQLQFPGQWAITTDAEQTQWVEMRPSTDIPHGHTWAKLQLLVETDYITTSIVNDREEETRAIYGLPRERSEPKPTEFHLDEIHYFIHKRVKRVQIELLGTNLSAQTFDFALSRSDDGSIQRISEIT